MNTIDTGTLIAIMAGTFALTTTVIGVLFRQLLRVYKDKNEQHLETMRTDYNGRLAALTETVAGLARDREDCEKRENKSFDRLESALIKNQDQWVDFQKSAATMEATRGRRLDAFFDVIDHQRDEIRSIKSTVYTKAEKMYHQAFQDLKIDLRAEIKNYVDQALRDKS